MEVATVDLVGFIVPNVAKGIKNNNFPRSNKVRLAFGEKR
jgi:hypothetical protein